eukprot:2968251-Rhodomonas_salina.2
MVCNAVLSPTEVRWKAQYFCGVRCCAISYGTASQCPVLTKHIVLCYLLRNCFEMPGTDAPYGATRELRYQVQPSRAH